jgi:hypothetical protein
LRVETRILERGGVLTGGDELEPVMDITSPLWNLATVKIIGDLCKETARGEMTEAEF